MSAATFYAQINFVGVAGLDAVPAGQIGLCAKADGLYAALPSVLDARLLTTFDIGVTVAAFNHTHNYDNYQYWDCKVGVSTSHVVSAYTVEHYAGTGINLTVGNPAQGVTRITHAISDDVVRKSGTPAQYQVPIFSNANTIISDTGFFYGSSILNIYNAAQSVGHKLYCASSNSADSNNIYVYRSYQEEAIPANVEILDIQASGFKSTGQDALVGQILFTSAENFGPNNSGCAFSIKTCNSGVGGSLAVRHLISGAGLTRIGGGLLVGSIASDPVSVLESEGSFGAAITSTTMNLTLTAAHFSIIITGAYIITLPAASSANGRIYIIANKTGAARTISAYVNMVGTSIGTIASLTSIIIQSNGSVWHLIN